MASSLLGGVSSSCQSALPSLLTSGFASCANLLDLVSVATSAGSVVPALTSYVEDLCEEDPCSAEDLASASTIIQNGCASDIAANATFPVALNLIVTNFDGVRALLCTQRTSNSSYCVPEILAAAQNATGADFSVTSLATLGAGNATQALLDTIPKEVYCTDCGDAIITEAINIARNSSVATADEISAAAVQQCGATFGDGQLPAGITNGTAASGVTNTAATPSNAPTGAAYRGMNLSGKTLTIIGTVSAAILGASMTIV